MIEEIKLLNHWLVSKDPGFMYKHSLDVSYFTMTDSIYLFIEEYVNEYKETPSLELVANRCSLFTVYENLDSVDYLIDVLKQHKMLRVLEPKLTDFLNKIDESDNNIREAIGILKTDIDLIMRAFSSNDLTYESWNKDALKRFESYMAKHGQEGLPGFPTGIPSLDEITGGWRDDDLILLSARTGEGKSLLALYFAFQVWRYFVLKNIKQPVVYIITEMPELEIFYRLDTMKSHFSNRALNEGKLPEPSIYKEYLEELTKYEPDLVVISQEANGGKPFSPMDIRAIIETYNPGFMVIDQLYDLVDGTGERDLRKRIVNVSTQIRDINLQYKIPTILVSQAGRDAAKEAKRDPEATPELYHIQESDNPAQKATRVLTIRMLKDKVKITVRKNRGGIKDKDIYVVIDIDTGVWEEINEQAVVF